MAGPIIIKNCTFTNAKRHGIYGGGNGSILIEDTTINNSGGDNVHVPHEPRVVEMVEGDDGPLLLNVPFADLLAALTALRESKAASVEEASKAMAPTGIERWLAVGANLANLATYLLNNPGFVAKFFGG